MTLTILPEILIPQLYLGTLIYQFFFFTIKSHHTVFLLVFLFCQLYFTISQNYCLSLLNVEVT
jgi:hypothetical protein